MKAGEYVILSDGGLNSYFGISKDSSGTLSSIIANDNFTGNTIVTVKKGQYLQIVGGTAIPIKDAEVDTTGAGMFKVGKHIKAGEYKIILDETASGFGYYEVSSNSSHTLTSVVANENITGDSYITVKKGQYLKLVGCHLKKSK